MNETPDFSAIARHVREDFTEHLELSPSFDTALEQLVAEQLRLMWNTRGATDIALVGRELSSMMGATAGGPYIKNLDRALRALDR